VVAHYKFEQGCLICCFCQVAAVLPYSWVSSFLQQRSLLFGALSSAFWNKRERNEIEKQPGGFFPEQACCNVCATSGFTWLLGAIKNYFEGKSLNFMCT
jgi:hypothetical protein